MIRLLTSASILCLLASVAHANHDDEPSALCVGAAERSVQAIEELNDPRPGDHLKSDITAAERTELVRAWANVLEMQGRCELILEMPADSLRAITKALFDRTVAQERTP